MCRCAAITTGGSVVRRAALWQSEDKNGKNMAGAGVLYLEGINTLTAINAK
jgi:hypothetical protein